MKPKGHWIEKYNLETDDKQLISSAIFNTTEILKVNVKPKTLWFIQHVFTKNEIEEGEICSDDEREHHEHHDGGNGKANFDGKENPSAETYSEISHGMAEEEVNKN